MEDGKETKETRRPYHKPQLEQVQLVAEEAVLVGCKTKKATGPDAGPCNARGSGKCQVELS
jgi:hypothetical protein